jgi:TonB family protein
MNTRRFFLYGLVLTFLNFFFETQCLANAAEDRISEVKRIAAVISQHSFKKVFVPDFLDPVAGRTDKGCYFASFFSTHFAKLAASFEVVNRIDAQRRFMEVGSNPSTGQKVDSARNLGLEMKADVLLTGKFEQQGTSINLELSLMDLTVDEEIYHSTYREQSTDAFEVLFPASSDPKTQAYYFASLDGVKDPRCISCPNPDFTSDARQKKIEGKVLISTVISSAGTPDSARVVSKLYPSLDQSALKAVKKWRLTPATDRSGNTVAVRLPVEVAFRFY